MIDPITAVLAAVGRGMALLRLGLIDWSWMDFLLAAVVVALPDPRVGPRSSETGPG